MTYVQRWLLAVSLFITLLLIGVLASFVLTPTPMPKLPQTPPSAKAATF